MNFDRVSSQGSVGCKGEVTPQRSSCKMYGVMIRVCNLSDLTSSDGNQKNIKR